MKILIQKINSCQRCPYCWAGAECAKIDRPFNFIEERRGQTDVQSWCQLPDDGQDCSRIYETETEKKKR